jgi:hypothetical protein
MNNAQVMDEKAMAIKPLDVFSWRYTEARMKELRKQLSTDDLIYWCCSRFCIARNDGLLFDTYWGAGNNRRVLPNECDLVFLGNLGDYERANFMP